MTKYAISGTSGTARNPFHFEPDATWGEVPLLPGQQIAVGSKGTTQKITVLDLNDSYAELGRLINLEPAGYDGWSASTFVDLIPATQGGITAANNYLSGVTSVTNGYVANKKSLATFMKCSKLKNFDAGIVASDASFMFTSCSQLPNFSASMPNIKTGNQMFSGCVALTSFTSNLDKLYKADGMFGDCIMLTNWTVALPKLWNGTRMFNITVSAYQGKAGIRSWSVELPELENAQHMFGGSQLTSWTMDVPKLKKAGRMFDCCYALTSFNASFPVAQDVNALFYKCSALTDVTINIPSIIQDAPTADTKPYENVTNKGTYLMFDKCNVISSVTLTTTVAIKDYLTPALLGLRGGDSYWHYNDEENEGLITRTFLYSPG